MNRTMRYCAAMIAGAVIGNMLGHSVVSSMAQQAPQKPPFQLLLEQQIGAQAVDAAMLRAQAEQLQTIVAERDKTIAGLKAELAEAKKPAEAPK